MLERLSRQGKLLFLSEKKLCQLVHFAFISFVLGRSRKELLLHPPYVLAADDLAHYADKVAIYKHEVAAA